MRYIVFFLLVVDLISCKEPIKSVKEHSVLIDTADIKFLEIPDTLNTYKGYYLVNNRNDSILGKILFKDYNPFLYYHLPILDTLGSKLTFLGHYNFQEYINKGQINYDLSKLSISDISPYLSENISIDALQKCIFNHACSFSYSKVENNLLMLFFSFDINGSFNDKLQTITLSSRFIAFNKKGEIVVDLFDKNHFLQNPRVVNNYLVLDTYSYPYFTDESGFRIINISTKETVAIRKYKLNHEFYIYPKSVMAMDNDNFLINVKRLNKWFELYLFNIKSQDLSKYVFKKEDENFNGIKVVDKKIVLYTYDECLESAFTTPYMEKILTLQDFKKN